MAEVKEAPKPQVPKGQNRSAELKREPSTPGDITPLVFMRRFADEMDRFFDDFGSRLPGFMGRGRDMMRRDPGFIPAEWSPRVEVRERGDQFLVRADLPGLSKDDVQVELTDQLMTIRGERKHEQEERLENSLYSECSYGSMYRVIPLPEGVDPSKATAEFHNGVLEVAMPAPRRMETRAHRLEIQEKP